MPAPNCCGSCSTTGRRVPWKRKVPPTKQRTKACAMKATDQMPTEQLINELQSFGVRLIDPSAGHESRRGGAGPSDHKAMIVDGITVMVPVHTAPAFASPYVIDKPDARGHSRVRRDD